LKIPVSHGHLEAVLREPSGPLRGGAVFCHPHPLHGGTMHTKAVYRAAQALNDLGLRVLRFNFRGIGCSTGTFDEGIGEMDDVRAALDSLELGLAGGAIVLGGLSFGSLMALAVGAEDPRVGALVALGAPVQLYDYSFLSRAEKPVLVIQGERDPFGSPDDVSRAFSPLGPHVTVLPVPGAGHLFEEHFEELQAGIRTFFSQGPGGRIFRASGESHRKPQP